MEGSKCPWYPAARGLAQVAGMGTMNGKEADKQPGNRQGRAGQKSLKKAERESCKAKSKTSIQWQTGGKSVSERKASGSVRWDVRARPPG